MMRWSLICLVLLGAVPLAAQPDFVLITSKQTPVQSLSQFQLRDLYLGKAHTIEGAKLRPVQLQAKDPTRRNFEKFIFDQHFDFEEYWLIQRLQGAGSPPLAASGWGMMLVYISRNPGFIGYIPRAKLDRVADYPIKVITLTDN